jgi:hypothetical protein
MVRRLGHDVLHPLDPLLRQPKTQRAFSLRLVNQRSVRRNNKNIPHDHRAMDRGNPNRQIDIWASQSAIGNQKQEYVMTTPMDNTLTAIGRQLSVAYLPTVLEPLPRELNDLVAQLVALEMCKPESSARPSETLQFVMAQHAPDPSSTDPSMER